MKFGVSVLMQNYPDYPRFLAAERGSGEHRPTVSDADVYAAGLRIGCLAEPLGFDSIWTVEHHFTPYTMVADPYRLLAFFAGNTKRVNIGTMVSVLPWNDPIRVAEAICMLDQMLEGRELFVGMGRGTGKREFDGLRIDMNETRGRFSESIDIIKLALSGEQFSYDGEFHKIPPVQVRPRPRSTHEELIERLYMSWGSPQSMPIAAELGLKPLLIPQRAWDDYAYELSDYFGIRDAAGYAPAHPKLVTWTVCAKTEAEAEDRARRYDREYADSALTHYQLLETHFAQTKDYEHYAKRSELLREMVDDPLDVIVDMYMNTFVWGTPEQCVEKITAINRHLAPTEIICPFWWGTMPPDEGEESMRLFASDVIPHCRDLPEQPVVGTVPLALPERAESADTVFAGASAHLRKAGATPG